jgi:hypothetical protein
VSENPEGETLLRTLVQLGKALSIETLAEGIELEHQLELLQDERCDSGQGFLFARPLSVEDAEALLENWNAGDRPQATDDLQPPSAPQPTSHTSSRVHADVLSTGGRSQRMLAAGSDGG